MKLLCFLACALSFSLFAQKKIIDHTVYDSWKTKSNVTLSNDGKFVAYVIKPHKGNSNVYLYNTETNKLDSFQRAKNPSFDVSSSLFLFSITPDFDTLRNLELKKVKKDKWPKDSLGIYFLQKDSLVKINRISEYTLAENAPYLAYLSEDNDFPKSKIKSEVSKKKKKKSKKKTKEEKIPEISSDGKFLTVISSEGKKILEAKNVTKYIFSEKSASLAFQLHQKVDKKEFFSLATWDLSKNEEQFITDTFTQIAQFNFNSFGNKLAIVASYDTVKIGKKHQLQLYDLNQKRLSPLVNNIDGELALNKSVSEFQNPYFSIDDNYLFFGIGNKPKLEVKDTLLESEKATLDLWHWEDDRLQPQQLLELKRDKKDSWLSVFDLNKNSYSIIENDSLQIRHNRKNPSPFVLAYNEKPYENTYNWEYPNPYDVYRINIFNGEKELIRKQAIYQTQLSPSGNYVTYFNQKDSAIYLYDFNSKTTKCVTCLVKASWLSDVNGMPIIPNPESSISWFPNEKGFIINSKYILYTYSIEKHQLTPYLSNTNEKEGFKYNLNVWSYDSLYFYESNAYLTKVNDKTKEEALYVFTNTDESPLKLIEQSNHHFSGISKAKNANTIHFQKSNVKDYSDSYVFTNEIKKISNTNPQQEEYNWVSVEPITWKANDGQQLNGLFYKPENFDPSKKYPLLIYYYELYSDDLHNHYIPKPTASIIYPTEYASAGYLVFIPDIRYNPGHPAKGAYNAIMSGTDYLLKNHNYIDSTKMGLQGQSWGGYQTAQLVTMTSRYAAAMAGAPVSNMFSAYGGIRWGSGLNRQFQYERTQSRIGKTIWEAPELYVENSPLFHLPKVKTPLLIMHNDADGAVPWYQGIELFTGLKRLGKPTWLLNYNNDDHNLMKNANRMDLSIRMRQFFDYYLLEKPAPRWLIEGLPAIDKGEDYRLDLLEK